MRALRWHGRQDMRLDEIPEPTPSDALDTLVEISHCGICGTDIAEFRSGPVMISLVPHPLSGQAPPVTLGHEFVGRVLAQAPAPAQPLAPGQRVTADACLRCGSCAACLRGDYHRCRLGGSVGLNLDGGFARLAALPSYLLVPVPDRVSDIAAAQAEPFAVALHGLDRAQLRGGDEILVLGFGPIGAAAALVARALGARPYVVEPQPERRTLAERIGMRTLEPGEDLARRVRGSIGDGGAAIVVDSTGVPEIAALAVDCAARGGRIALLGLSSRVAQIELRRLTMYERSLVGSLGYCNDLPRVLKMMDDRVIDPEPLVGAVIPLDRAAGALQELAHQTPPAVKTLVRLA